MRLNRLDIAYKLTGDAIPPVEALSPCSIEGALAHAGLMPARFDGMGVFEGEWVQNRPFAFEGIFDAGTWECERAYLEFEWLRGSGRVLLNGAELGTFTGGFNAFDATCAICAGINALRVEFDKGNERGIAGGVMLRGCWSLHVRTYALENCNEGICVNADISAHAAGRYAFNYRVSQGDEAIGAFSFEEKLGAKCAHVGHMLKLPEVSGACRVLMTVLRAGDECDACEGWVDMSQDAESDHRPAVSLGDGAGMSERLKLLLDAGVRDFYIKPDTYLPEAFLRAADEIGARVYMQGGLRVPHACVRTMPEKLPDRVRHMGMPLIKPPKRPIPLPAMQALGGDMLREDADALFGVGALGDIAMYARAIRYIQAQKISADVERTNAVPELGEGFGLIADCDLFDQGVPRPAYYALKAAHNEPYAYADFDMRPYDADERITVRICVRGAALGQVVAEVFEMSGRSVNRVEYTHCQVGCVGKMSFMPGGASRILLLRVSGWHGGGAGVRDYAIVLCSDAPYAALMRMKPALIKCAGDLYTNVSDVIALGMAREDGGSALLPGEVSALSNTEGVNAVEYAAPRG